MEKDSEVTQNIPIQIYLVRGKEKITETNLQIGKCLQISETITRYRSKFDTIFEKVDTIFIDRSNKF